MIDVERLLDKLIGPIGQETVDLIPVDDAGDNNNLSVRKVRVGSNHLTNQIAVNVRQQIIEHEHIRTELFSEQAGFIAGAGRPGLEATVTIQNIDQ